MAIKLITNDEIDTALKEMYREQNKQLDKDIEMFVQTLADRRQRISKEMFETYFLKEFMSGSLSEEALAAWTTYVSHGPQNPVEVMDADGQVAVVVPALIDTTMVDIDPGERSSETLEAASATYARQVNHLPIRAINEYKNNLGEWVNRKVHQTDGWTLFMEYYKDYTADAEEKIEDPVEETFDESSLFK